MDVTIQLAPLGEKLIIEGHLSDHKGGRTITMKTGMRIFLEMVL